MIEKELTREETERFLDGKLLDVYISNVSEESVTNFRRALRYFIDKGFSLTYYGTILKEFACIVRNRRV